MLLKNVNSLNVTEPRCREARELLAAQSVSLGVHFIKKVRASPHVENMQNLWGHNRIGKTTKIGEFCDIGNVTIGERCKIQCHVSIPSGWTIGDDVFIGPGARFANDKHPRIGGVFIPQGGRVEDGASIGMGALIGPGVIIGPGSMVGMGAVVLKDVPAGATVVGNPAREI
jgi:acetyltransferase-like isoleucine patch superfamily enzyme